MRLSKNLKYFIIGVIILATTVVVIIASAPYWSSPSYILVVLNNRLLQLLGKDLQPPSFEVFIKIDKEYLIEKFKTGDGMDLFHHRESPKTRVKVNEKIFIRPFLLYQGNHLLSIFFQDLFYVQFKDLYGNNYVHTVYDDDGKILITYSGGIYLRGRMTHDTLKPGLPYSRFNPFSEWRVRSKNKKAEGGGFPLRFDYPGIYTLVVSAYFEIPEQKLTLQTSEVFTKESWLINSLPIRIEVVDE